MDKWVAGKSKQNLTTCTDCRTNLLRNAFIPGKSNPEHNYPEVFSDQRGKSGRLLSELCRPCTMSAYEDK